MKRVLITACVIATLFCGTALADRSKAVDKALKQQYPDAKTEVIGSKTVNGVKVNEVRVTTKDGDSTALVTDAGDFLVSGTPVNPKLMPQAASRALSGLFKNNPSDVERNIATSYTTEVEAGGKLYALRFDPVGRLRDISNEAEIKRADLSKTDMSTSDSANKVRELASKRYDGAKVSEIHLYPPAGEGFYVATMDTEDGRVDFVADANGTVYSQRQQLDKDKLPAPVRDTIEKMFTSANIKNVYRTTYDYYQFNAQSTGGDLVTIKVRPNGDILSVANREAIEADAKPASSKQAPASDKDSKKQKAR
ncbi:hypothetical protein BH09PLA1_BH09PLA1_22580 [soil metagenome]